MTRSISIILLLGACATTTDGANEGDKRSGTGASSAAVEVARTSTARFGGAIYERVATEPGNIALSPASIAATMFMVSAAGYDGTDTMILNAMGQSQPPHAEVAELLDLWKSDARLRVVNRLWHSQSIASTDLDATFTSVMENSYYAPVTAAQSPDPEEWRVEVNDWVYTNTVEKIRDLIPPGVVDGRTSMIWANAAYFKGDWEVKFDPCMTNDASFEAPSGPTTVRMMHATSQFAHSHFDGGQILEMPFTGGDIVMDFILPEPGTSLDARVALELQTWIDSVDRAHALDVVVSLPQFELPSGQSISLAGVLGALGVPFEAASHLGGAFVDRRKEELQAVLHQAVVRVDELGAVAAAGTAAVAGTRAAVRGPTVFTADRPFLFVIRHRPSDAVLFLGRIDNPPAVTDPPSCE